MEIEPLTQEERVWLREYHRQNPEKINKFTLVELCGVSYGKAERLLKAWHEKGCIELVVKSSGGYGVSKRNVFTQKALEI